ncbi:MAG TPA: AraC family transcriptional regulator [Clostridia bacterium]|jgi:YesN/AraC family two-component response regulator|nr:AraC family transcriptional regulator [Clostridia bacterium]HPO53875.1 AraC family transcriptional regulator [Clostridia bacterium]
MPFLEVDQNIEKEGWAMPDLHSHPHYELYFLEKGERDFFIGSTLFLVKENTAVLVPPFVMHKTEGGPFSRINVNFTDNIFDEKEKALLAELSRTMVFPLKHEDGETVKRLMYTMLANEESHTAAEKEAAKLCAKAIIGCLYLYRGAAKEAEKITFSGRIKPETLKIIKYINENFRNKLTIGMLAKQFNLSESCLSKSFKRETGYNVSEFILQTTINEAKHLLGSTKLSVNEIAEKLGFSSANYFGLIFKQKVGLSPLAYRKYLLS